jgi:hypothetical protein
LKGVLREAWPVIAWAAFILLLTSVPISGPDWALDRIPLDKLAHFGLYAGLGWVLAGSLERLGMSRGLWVLLAIAGLIFAAADEWHQTWIVGRAPTFGDWLADAFGLIVGMTLHWWKDSDR